MYNTRRSILNFSLLILVVTLFVPALTRADQQLLRNPTLLDRSGNGLPDHWWRLTQREGRVEKHDGEERFLRLEVNQPGESVIFEQYCELSKAEPITVMAKVRWTNIQRGSKGYMTGAIQAMFTDAKRKKIGNHMTVEQLTGDSDGWQVLSETFTPKPGVTKVRIQVAMYSVKSGQLDVQWVTATPGETGTPPPADELAEANAPTTKPDRTLLDRFPLPPGDGPEYGGVKGVSLLGSKPFENLKPYRNLDKWSVERVPVENMPFSEAQRITIHQQPAAVWDMQLRAKVNIPVNKGDLLHLTYWMRGIKIDSEFAETSCLTALQLDRSPWTSVISQRSRALVGDGWQKVQRVFVAKDTFDQGQTAFSFQFGLEPQTFEIGGLSCYNYGSSIDQTLLPQTEIKLYAGHELDHPWRAEAARRIEKYRKGDLTVTVVDADGTPVPQDTVQVDMTRHAFGWGSAMYIWAFAGESEKAQTYKKHFLELFNTVVPENGLKWSTWEQENAQPYTRAMVKWAHENKCEVRGHTLVWPSWSRSPKRLEAFKNQPDKLEAEIEKHIRDIVLANKGLIREWDVMNEPTTNYDFMKLLGEEAPADWFKLAAQLDPDALLFLNENQILAGTKLKSLELYLDRLLKYGAPLGGIGIQGHLGVGTAAPMKMLSIYDRLSRYNVPLAITELDVLHEDPELQAMYLRDVLICAFSHPSVESVTFWGFWDGRHWLNNTPLYNKDWTPKPGLDVYKKLVLNEWWTRETLTTDQQGRAGTRGFLGTYSIHVEHEGQSTTSETVLSRDGTDIVIQL